MNFGFWFLVFGLKKIGVDAHPFLGDLNSLNPKSQISKPRSCCCGVNPKSLHWLTFVDTTDYSSP
jgi:hypothetical protein